MKRPREQSPSILPQVAQTQAKHKPTSAATSQHTNIEKNITRPCLECNKYERDDKRNYYYCQLLNEEFMYIKPCIRSRCYIKILNFLEHAKNAHFDEINMDLSDTEKQ